MSARRPRGGNDEAWNRGLSRNWQGEVVRNIAPLQSKLAQVRVIVGTASERPVVLAFAVLDRKVVDTRDAQAHQAVLVELPVLVAVAAEPAPAIVVPLVGKPHGDAVVAERPDLLDQAVVQFLAPLAGQKGFDRLPALQEFRAVSPLAIGRIG